MLATEESGSTTKPGHPGLVRVTLSCFALLVLCLIPALAVKALLPEPRHAHHLPPMPAPMEIQQAAERTSHEIISEGSPLMQPQERSTQEPSLAHHKAQTTSKQFSNSADAAVTVKAAIETGHFKSLEDQAEYRWVQRDGKLELVFYPKH